MLTNALLKVYYLSPTFVACNSSTPRDSKRKKSKRRRREKVSLFYTVFSMHETRNFTEPYIIISMFPAS